MLLFWDRGFWIKIPISFDPTSVHFGEFWFKTIYRILIGFTGTLFFFSLFKNHIPNNLFVMEWGGVGKHTLCIYMFQTLIIERILCQYVDFSGINPLVYNFILTPIIAAAVIVLCLQIGWIISKSSLASFLFFGKPYTSE